MNKISVDCGVETVSIAIKNIKYLLGFDYNKKWKIINEIKSAIDQDDSSEFSTEFGISSKVLVNEKRILNKSTFYFAVSPWFNFDDDMKLGSKSILSKYISSFIEEIEFEEDFTLLSNVFDSLNSNYLEKKDIQYNDLSLKFIFKSMNSKIIQKLLVTIALKDDYQICNYNLSIDERIILQLMLIEKVALKNVSEVHFIFLEVQEVSESVKNFLSSIKCDNLYVLVIVPCVIGVETEEILIVNGSVIDCYSEEDVYRYFVEELDFACNISDAKKKLSAIIGSTSINWELVSLLT